jgi:hypothetical protein
MCGIVGYVGHQNAVPILVEGLHRLEYRGYDSAGLALQRKNGIAVHKRQGKVREMEASLPKRFAGVVGVGHTRWATHGAPSDANAHPQADATGRVVVVHNGIIDNAHALRAQLEARGVVLVAGGGVEIALAIEGQARGLVNASAGEDAEISAVRPEFSDHVAVRRDIKIGVRVERETVGAIYERAEGRAGTIIIIFRDRIDPKIGDKKIIGLGEGSEDQETAGNCQGALEFHKVEREQNNSATLTAGRAPRRVVPALCLTHITLNVLRARIQLSPARRPGAGDCQAAQVR